MGRRAAAGPPLPFRRDAQARRYQKGLGMSHHPNARANAFVERFDALGRRERACQLRSSRALTTGGTPVMAFRCDATP